MAKSSKSMHLKIHCNIKEGNERDADTDRAGETENQGETKENQEKSL